MRRLSVFPVLLACLSIAWLLPAQGALPKAESGFTIAAKSAYLIEPISGMVVYAQNEREKLPPASVTKVMTMLLIMEALDHGKISLEEPIVASAAAAGIGGSQVFLKEGESFPLRKMLIAIAVESANDASAAVAEHLYSTTDDFVRLMNTRAKQLGMTDTHFANEHGLPDPDHYMSARDIAIISRELITKHPAILKYTSIWTYTFRPGISELRNTNELIRYYRGADGLKTGHTEAAGFCLAGTAKREGMRLLSVVLGTESNATRLRETRRLLDYGFRNFQTEVFARKGQEVGTMGISGATGQARVVAPREIVAVVPRGQARKYETRIVPRSGVKAPVKKGAVVADLEVVGEGKVVSRQPVVAAANVGRAFFLVRIWWALTRWIRGLFM